MTDSNRHTCSAGRFPRDSTSTAAAAAADQMVDPDIAKQARAIQLRLSEDLSFAALWKRLDQAERDRDRMLNALQYVRDQMRLGRLTAEPRVKAIISRALARVKPFRSEGQHEKSS